MTKTEPDISYDFGQTKEHRQVTDEDIDRMRVRIGTEVPIQDPYNRVATADAIRHYAYGIGDDNPLFCDEAYARKTRWGTIIAPPYFVETMGVSRAKEIPREARERGRGALSGVHSWYSGDAVELLVPVHVGDKMTVKAYIASVEVKESEFAGRTVHTTRRYEWVNQRGQLVAVADRLYVAGGRERTPGERKKYAELVRQSYAEEEIRRIEQEYEKEVRRGATPLFWEDVQVGEEVPSLIKGPLTISDIIAFDMGRGSPYIRAHRRAYLYRKRHPAAYPLDEFGIPDVVERVHWSEELARKTGNPAPYDYGAQRFAWLCQLMTNWMGDEGFLRRFKIELRRFNYVGDITWCKGKVVEKYEEESQHLVKCEVWCQDQRDRVTARGETLVALSSRRGGPVKLIVRPAAWQENGEIAEVSK